MKDNKWTTILALAFAVWFALTGWIWTSLINIFVGYPVGLAALILYRKERKRVPSDRLNNWVLIVLIAGWLISIFAILLYK